MKLGEYFFHSAMVDCRFDRLGEEIRDVGICQNPLEIDLMFSDHVVHKKEISFQAFHPSFGCIVVGYEYRRSIVASD